MRATTRLPVFVLGCVLSGCTAPRHADEAARAHSTHTQPTPVETVPAETTRQTCTTAIAEARTLAETLPADDASRYFAERYLQQATTEVADGELEDCLELTGRATQEVREHRHALQPGEKLNVRKADE